mmetsp:Transcript_1059/g.1987  ORF Transcript_1059/g.1987 Transcript_1059/m.1987 type:complete len:221 (-) Transcript_1059:788-1450(-)
MDFMFRMHGERNKVQVLDMARTFKRTDILYKLTQCEMFADCDQKLERDLEGLGDTKQRAPLFVAIPQDFHQHVHTSGHRILGHYTSAGCVELSQSIKVIHAHLEAFVNCIELVLVGQFNRTNELVQAFDINSLFPIRRRTHSQTRCQLQKRLAFGIGFGNRVLSIDGRVVHVSRVLDSAKGTQSMIQCASAHRELLLTANGALADRLNHLGHQASQIRSA